MFCKRCFLPFVIVTMGAILFTFLSCSEQNIFEVLNGGELMPVPTSAALEAGATLDVNATGGIPPYVFSCLTGSIDEETGMYAAPTDQSTDTITVEDSSGATKYLSIVVIMEPLSISPGALNIEANGNYPFTVTGGLPPYDYTLDGSCYTDKGSIASDSTNSIITYTAPSTPCEDITLLAEDSLGNMAEAVIHVFAAGSLLINPPSATIQLGSSVRFTLSGGTSPYSYSYSPADGSALNVSGSDNENAEFTPANDGVYTITGQDNASASKSATVIVELVPLTLSPTSANVHVGDSFTFHASGGKKPYTFELLSGHGTIDSETGLYTAVKQGNDRVRVTDSFGNTADAAVKISK